MIKTSLAVSALIVLSSGAAMASTVNARSLHDELTSQLTVVSSFQSDLELENGAVGGNGPSVVPLPAAGWMLLAGIGGIALMRRRAKA